MIRHQYVGVNRAAVPRGHLANKLKVALSIELVAEAGFPIVAALNYVLTHIGNVEARLASHAASVDQI